MSDTSDFRTNPRTFLESKVVMVPEDTDKATGRPGKFKFKLESVSRNLFSLEKAGDDESDVIAAHYLPWETGAATTMDLDGTADFFFTSEMTNCRFTVMAANPKAPKVAHIAGTLDKGKRNEEELKVFGAKNRVRRLSVSGAVGVGAHTYRGQDNSDPQLRSSAFVYGVRDDGGWKFFAQVVKGVMSSKPELLEDIRELNFVDILALKKTDKESGKS